MQSPQTSTPTMQYSQTFTPPNAIFTNIYPPFNAIFRNIYPPMQSPQTFYPHNAIFTNIYPSKCNIHKHLPPLQCNIRKHLPPNAIFTNIYPPPPPMQSSQTSTPPMQSSQTFTPPNGQVMFVGFALGQVSQHFRRCSTRRQERRPRPSKAVATCKRGRLSQASGRSLKFAFWKTKRYPPKYTLNP